MKHKINGFKILLGFYSILLLFSCKDEDSLINRNPVKVEAISVKKEKIENTIKTLGTLSYKSKHNVSSLVSGRLVSLNVKEGDFVNKGQCLGNLRNIQLENQKEMYENNLSEAEASLLIAEDNFRTERLNIEKQMKCLEKLNMQIQQTDKEYEYKKKCFLKSQELYSVGGISESKLCEEEMNLEQLKTSVEVMKKEYEISSVGFRNEDIEKFGYEVPASQKEIKDLIVNINSRQASNAVVQERTRVDSVKKSLLNMELLMDELKIKSTVSGIVATCNFQIGDHVSENETCFVIFDTSNLNAVFYVQEQEIGKYKTNSKLLVAIPSITESFETFVSEISPVADPVTGNFCVKAEICNSNNILKPGMFINCTLLINDLEYLTIPESCLLYDELENPMVLCISNNHVFYRKIKIYCKKNGLLYIEEGLKENDMIVNLPSLMLKEGETVEIQ